MNGVPLILLFVISVFTMNLTLQCALGIKGTAESKKSGALINLIKTGIIFFSIVVLWLMFSKVLVSISTSIFIYILLVPVSFIVYEGLEFLVYTFLYKNRNEEESFISFPGGITAAAVFICMNIADGILQTLVLSFGFTGGIFLVSMIVREIRKRAALEKVPYFMRGKPLVLVAMGLMSLVFMVGSLLILRMIGAR
jgi:Na+-translocating ferredoxin:NAD+ oxidoreductase RnfA subunit